MFPLKTVNINTRHSEKYNVIRARTERLKKSAIPSMAKMLNLHIKRVYSITEKQKHSWTLKLL